MTLKNRAAISDAPRPPIVSAERQRMDEPGPPIFPTPEQRTHAWNFTRWLERQPHQIVSADGYAAAIDRLATELNREFHVGRDLAEFWATTRISVQK